MNSLVSLGISVAMLLAAAGLGRRLRVLGERGAAGPPTASAGERVVTDVSIGLGILSAAVFVLCAAQMLQPVPGIVCAVLLVAVSLPGLPGVVGDLLSCVRRAAKPAGVWTLLAAELLIAIAIGALIPALAPPAMSDWDSLAYHLAVPKLFIEHGGFYYIHFTTHSNFPFLVEMLYIPGLALGDPVAAKLMHFWYGVLLVAAVLALTRKHVSREAGPAAALATAGMPIVMWEAATAYVDLAAALYTVLAVHLLLNYLDSRKESLSAETQAGRGGGRDLLLCACAAGFAASTKMTGLALIPMLAIWLAAADRKHWHKAAWLAGVSLAVCWPWYFKSVVYTGNPVYPFFYSLFGGRDWTQALADNYTMLQKKFGLGHSLGALLMLPYNLAFHSEAFYDRPGLYVGPLALVSIPVLAFARYRSAKLVGLLSFVLAQTALWFSLSQQSRYLIPALSILGALACGLAYRDERLVLARKALAGVFAATAVFGVVVMLWPSIRETARTAFGAESRKAYLSRQLDIYPACEYINKRLPRSARVALFGDTRGFYLNRAYVWADHGHNLMFSREFGSVDALSAYLRKNGFTHALVNFGVAFPRREQASGTAKLVYEAAESGRWRRVFPEGLYGSAAVYELR